MYLRSPQKTLQERTTDSKAPRRSPASSPSPRLKRSALALLPAAQTSGSGLRFPSLFWFKPSSQSCPDLLRDSPELPCPQGTLLKLKYTSHFSHIHSKAPTCVHSKGSEAWASHPTARAPPPSRDLSPPVTSLHPPHSGHTSHLAKSLGRAPSSSFVFTPGLRRLPSTYPDPTSGEVEIKSHPACFILSSGYEFLSGPPSTRV